LHYLKVLAVIEDYFIATAAEAQNQTYIFLTKLKYSFINYQEAQVLKKDNIILKHQVDELLYQNSQLISYKTENEELRALLNFKEDKDFDLFLAKVIGKDINRSNTLIINKGKSDGIKEGYPAIIDNGIIIGKVIEVKDNLSTILLITDKLSSLAVSTISSNKTNGLAKGEYGLSIKVELIPQDLTMQENDLIITSGQEKDIPRGLILGKINRIISHENELFKSATISPLIDYEEISILSILLPKQY
jgi:rod shape-determining protein MreC